MAFPRCLPWRRPKETRVTCVRVVIEPRIFFKRCKRAESSGNPTTNVCWFSMRDSPRYNQRTQRGSQLNSPSRQSRSPLPLEVHGIRFSQRHPPSVPVLLLSKLKENCASQTLLSPRSRVNCRLLLFLTLENILNELPLSLGPVGSTAVCSKTATARRRPKLVECIFANEVEPLACNVRRHHDALVGKIFFPSSGTCHQIIAERILSSSPQL